MKRKYLQEGGKGAIIAMSEADFDALLPERRKKLKDAVVVFLKNKADGREVVIPKDEWSNYGKSEQDQWERVDDPEKRDKSVFDAAFAAGRPEKDEQVAEPQQDSGTNAGDAGVKDPK